MCRWLGYFGDPIPLGELIYDAPHSLIEQSRHARLQASYYNGDGFGLGWYRDDREHPGVYRNILPAWSDPNLRELATQIRSPLFLAHVRAATGTAIQQTNCHPFRHGRWIFVHNGFIADFARIRRELLLAVAPHLFASIEGTTDSELIFHLGLTFGLEEEPVPALERMAGFVEAVAADHGVPEPLQMTIGLSDGERLYAVRYASGPVANSLYVSEDIAARPRGGVRLTPGQIAGEAYPEDRPLPNLSPGARAIVSEPVGDLPGLWLEVPPRSALTVGPGPDVRVPFTPRPPA
ncbi:MAG TPA: class II glutamine amidotransferase [Thermoleophilaceae bacterium]|nr:class II glutamine amidotransferase [Thermoleophilaceae bacterium]